MVAVQLLCAAVLLIAASWRAVTPTFYAGRTVIASLSVSVAVWCLGVAAESSGRVPADISDAVIALGTGAAAGFLYLTVCKPGARTVPVALVVVLVVEPVIVSMLLAAGVEVGTPNVRGINPIWAAHITYLAFIMVAVAIVLSGYDYLSGTLAALAYRGFIPTALLILGAETLGLRVGSVLATPLVLTVMLISARPQGVFLLDQRRGEVLDSLGAYILILDKTGGLLEWNTAAEAFFADTAVGPLQSGVPAADVLGRPVPIGEDHHLTVASAHGDIHLVGYTVDAARLGRERGQRWIVVLSEDNTRPQATITASRALLGRPEMLERLKNAARDPSGPSALRLEVVEPADHRLLDARLERIAEALTELNPKILVGRTGRSVLAVLVPASIDAEHLASTIRSLATDDVAEISTHQATPRDPGMFVHSVLGADGDVSEQRRQPKWY